MPFVIDASILAAWLLPEERDPVAAAAIRRIAQDPAMAPSLLWFELRNMLIVNERRGRIDVAQTDRALALLTALPIDLDRSPDERALMAFARRHRLTVYDAAYLELAAREQVPIATLDAALGAAARTEAVELLTG